MHAAPTAREISLLVFILVTLLLFSRSNFGSRFSSSETDFSSTVQTTVLDTKSPSRLRTKLRWSSGHIPKTSIVAHVPGWTIFDNLYLLNGTLFIVTDDPSAIPDRDFVISTGIQIENGPIEEAKRVPTDKDMQNISTSAARQLFDSEAEVIDGVTWLVNDPPQFIMHYYHWSAELLFGFWRTYSSLDPLISPSGNTTLPSPRRMMFSHLDADHWRDYAHMNQLVLRSAFPSVSAEYSDDWRDRAEMARPFVFDRVVLADRSAAMHGYNFHRTQRTASEPFSLPGSAHWWSTIRSSIVEFSGIGEVTPGSAPVITYISRQGWGRRMLIQEDHEKLVEELYKLRDSYGYEVNVVSMDKLSRIEQLQLSARTTIMMGVHGNGLTSLVWMKPTPRSTVMEFFFPGGFAHDYEYTTRALGMVHYGFWGSSVFTSPQVPEVAYPEGFQGNSIPIDGAIVATLCHQRLSLSDEADD